MENSNQLSEKGSAGGRQLFEESSHWLLIDFGPCKRGAFFGSVSFPITGQSVFVTSFMADTTNPRTGFRSQTKHKINDQMRMGDVSLPSIHSVSFLFDVGTDLFGLFD